MSALILSHGLYVSMFDIEQKRCEHTWHYGVAHVNE
jgi:hypothetical protein